MESPTTRNQLGSRSVVARVGAMLALAAVGIAIYLLVVSFTENDETSAEPKKERKNRTEQKQGKKNASVPVGPEEAISLLVLR